MGICQVIVICALSLKPLVEDIWLTFMSFWHLAICKSNWTVKIFDGTLHVLQKLISSILY